MIVVGCCRLTHHLHKSTEQTASGCAKDESYIPLNSFISLFIYLSICKFCRRHQLNSKHKLIGEADSFYQQFRGLNVFLFFVLSSLRRRFIRTSDEAPCLQYRGFQLKLSCDRSCFLIIMHVVTRTH